MHGFDDTRYYLTTDPELQLLGSPAALAKQRSRGEGPPYLKLGKRIVYRGRDLNRYLDSCVIQPTTGPGRVGADVGGTAMQSGHTSRSGTSSNQHEGELASAAA